MNNYRELSNFVYNYNRINFRNITNNSLALNKLIKNEYFSNRSFKKEILNSFEKFSSVITAHIQNSISLIKNSLTQNSKEGYLSVYDSLLTSETPFVCGLGTTHVFETSLILHHIWGVPYIPASSLKGVCRQVAFWKLVEEKNINEADLDDFQKKFYGDLVDDEKILPYQLLFGAQDFKGLLLFLDAYPNIGNSNTNNQNNNKLFKLDIMNPHYSGYYSDPEGKTPPADWENPTPIFFLTVKEGVVFRFVVLFDKWRWDKIKKDDIIINDKKIKKNNNISREIDNIIANDNIKQNKNNNFFENILKEALTFYGVGSKTRLGYGSFKV
ncbi:MAG: type III-B CRISPR module RAMP protein Cmr6 [Exilispira sp.]|jgi:CRISPR-associated protein Cmr6|nr:type III-B CRISPR module RAMP protein Cmr6 [Exilispira sp.]